MEQIKERWANNNGVQLHYLTSEGADPNQTPVIFVPGAFGAAEQYRTEFKSLSPRRCVALSLRGRGKSDAPLNGYKLEDHAHDIETVIKHVGLSRYVLIAFSMGVPYAIQFCSKTQTLPSALIIVDYPAIYRKTPPEWPALVKEHISPDVAKPHVIDGLANDSEEVALWASLGELDIPVLVLRGMQDGSRLTDETAGKYRLHVPQAEIVEFPESGHELWKPDYKEFINTIKRFLDRFD